jgi:CBS domain-containing protein
VAPPDQAETAALAAKIDAAQTLAELQPAARHIDTLIVARRAAGVPIERIAGTVSDLNARLFRRAWSLLAPPEWVANTCLVVMGSEGRGEQLLKTDQDNALLLRDGFEPDGIDAIDVIAQRFTSALIDFGYPRCPGNIMLSNPLWCQPVAGFKATLRGWMFDGDADGAMDLAIFLDAAPVAGHAALLQDALHFIDAYLVDNDAFFARFAAAADQFDAGRGWWARIAAFGTADNAPLDLKKLGTFPIVHGVRALALQHHVHERATGARLRVLAERGHLSAPLARDLTGALHVLMALKLDHQLRRRDAFEAIDNLVRPAELAPAERDTLKEALAVVRHFRQHLRLHYRLDAL